MENWNAVAADVLAGIAEVGFEVTLQKRTAVPATPWDAGADTFTDSPMIAVDDQYRVRDAAGNLLQKSMRTLLVGVSGPAPAKADRVIVRGETFEVAEVREAAPGGQAVFYEIDLMVG
ncbi:MAG: hypothetical protein U5N55_12060 [Cypionkella sp.]|nr:hypothetical protein [Cypionkella sp.]